MSFVSIIIPAYNEADRIGKTVQACKSMGDEILVIDDGSPDDTFKVAENAGADTVIRMDKNSGKGAALNAGCAKAKGDILLLLDADLGDSASKAAPLLQPLLKDEADMTIAVFPKAQGKAGFGFVMNLSRWGIKHFTGKIIQAPLSGQRALRKEIFTAIGGFGSGFGVETALTIDVLRLGYRVQEVPVPLAHRASGRNLRGILHRGHQFLDVAKVLAQKALKR